jgi:putative intracellular protease/amidase/YHS domain-containing protein
MGASRAQRATAGRCANRPQRAARARWYMAPMRSVALVLSVMLGLVGLWAGCDSSRSPSAPPAPPVQSAPPTAPAVAPPIAVAPLPAPRPPAKIPVAVVLGPGAEVVDWSGPWGVFEYAFVPGYDGSPFELYTVAETTRPLVVSGGLTVVPNHSFADAPPPKVIVVPAQEEPSEAMLAWLGKAAPATDLTMSVCTGAFVLAKAGLLDGKAATTHHGAYAFLAAEFPKIDVRRGARFVDADGVSSAGGLTSGIDLALHVVERYFGRAVAEQTATQLEYQGQGWKDPASNVAFAERPRSTAEHPICPVCEMEIDPASAVHGTHAGHDVLFCSEGCKEAFEKAPDRYLAPAAP